AATMLFLALLLLALAASARPAILPVPGATDRAAARALLAQLAQLIPPQPLPPHGTSCQSLRPSALPAFARLPPLPRALARAALALALSGAACGAQAEAEVLALAQELGATRATALLQGLARLRGAPAPQAMSLLLSLAAGTPPRRCVPPAGLLAKVPPAGLRALRGCQCARRHRREDEDVCDPPGEHKAHEVLLWVPGVSTFYNLGTSIYYAFQGCEALASARALEAAEDLGYATLGAIATAAAGPVGFGVQLGLQPGLKAGVRALMGYFSSDGATPPPPPPPHSGPVLIV
ncbi:APOF protein, partial [Centropus unirufus]|nr:APOF protein [Centropus unirufus]